MAGYLLAAYRGGAAFAPAARRDRFVEEGGGRFPRFGASCNGSQIRGLPVQLQQEALNRLHLLLLEIRLAALAAYPGGNRL
jgi:hypothetical protein